MKLYFRTYYFLIFAFLLLSYCLKAQENVVDTIPKKKIEFGVFPVIAYTPETYLQLGTAMSLVIRGEHKPNDRFYRPSSILPFVIYSFRNQLQFGLETDLFLKNGWNAYNYLRYYIYPDYYYGVGGNTNADSVEIYTDEFARFNGKLTKAITPQLFVGINYDMQSDLLYGFAAGKVLEKSTILGIKGGSMFGAGPSIRFDSRNNVLYTTKGTYLSADAIFYGIGGDYSFNMLTLDFRKFFSIGSDKNVIAIQYFGRFTDGDVPFYKLPIIGGVNNLRGIRENRFRDNQATYAQIEYRRYLFWRFRAAVFTGMGSVAQSIDMLDFYSPKYIYGLGIRFQLLKTERLNVRADYGFSEDQSGFYFSIREAF